MQIMPVIGVGELCLDASVVVTNAEPIRSKDQRGSWMCEGIAVDISSHVIENLAEEPSGRCPMHRLAYNSFS